MTLVLILSVLFLAFANGANDNFKGVATLYGSGTTSFNRALLWATITTLLGSAASIVLAQGLITTFRGKGLVPDAVILNPAFAAAIAMGSALTVMFATRSSFPVSTTHALTGALVGAGLVMSPQGVNISKLGASFVIPLLASPIISITLAAAIYSVAKMVRKRCGVTAKSCLCIGDEIVGFTAGTQHAVNAPAVSDSFPTPVLRVGQSPSCRIMYSGSVFGLEARPVLDTLHFLSAGLVSFARGLNDTPKVVALLLVAQSRPPTIGFGAVALAIAIGGLISSSRVAETMSHKITPLNPGQGFVANSVTALLVVFASRIGVPVSTTHVSCGALFGIGLSTGEAKRAMIGSILLAWVTTLPVAMILGAVSMSLMRLVIQ